MPPRPTQPRSRGVPAGASPEREQATFRPETPRLNLVQGYLKTIGRSKI